MLTISCTFIGICLFIVGSSGNGLCILVFLRKKFRYRLIAPYFIVLLLADSIYLLFRLMKLLYYSQTLFKLHTKTKELCSQSFLAQAYEHASQTWPQLLVPLVHSETYIRFSLILMSIMSVQRTTFITRSLKLLVLPTTFKNTCKYKWAFFNILSAFLIAYLFEFAGLTLFCSKSNNRNITYDWFIYMNKYMENATYILTNTMSDRPDALKCVEYAANTLQQNRTLFIEQKPVCTREELSNILSYYFDQHHKPIVNLIQKIIFYQTGQLISRNEIRRKYHFHECLFPQEPDFFHRYYGFMFNRLLGLNRHTLLLAFGSIAPSIVIIASNIISVYRVRELNQFTSNYILPFRRRTDDTRRILVVITVECLFAIVNSWFTDIVLSLIYCKRNLRAGDDCPMYLTQNYDLFVTFDMFNSVSNIVLHCLCGKRFRNELRRLFQSFFNLLKYLFHKLWCCYFRIDFKKNRREPCVNYSASAVRNESSHSSNNGSHNHLYIKIETPSTSQSKHSCVCRWYFNQRSLANSRLCFECLKHNRTPHIVRHQSISQKTCITKQTQARSMRLYHPRQVSTSLTVNKNRC